LKILEPLILAAISIAMPVITASQIKADPAFESFNFRHEYEMLYESYKHSENTCPC
jgi:hypothetical protein